MPGVPTTPDDLTLSPRQALAEAQRLLDAGRPFHAHEVLEATWKAALEDERELWRGLAQLAVGLTHARRGNAGGAARLLLRAADRIGPYAERDRHGVPVRSLVRWARDLAAHIDRAGVAGLPEAALTPRLGSVAAFGQVAALGQAVGLRPVAGPVDPEQAARGSGQGRKPDHGFRPTPP